MVLLILHGYYFDSELIAEICSCGGGLPIHLDVG